MVTPPDPGPGAPLLLRADPGVCAGAGQCVRAAPDLFDQDEDGLVVPLAATVPAEARERALAAADWCPSGAVAVVPAAAPPPSR
ncbi:(4Fe-4S)-binding protein [Streptomonospora sp. S1-112]|uniref:(4Fe-4S)-binding protein n=1 Tax=Streptomonospora mangrovi TaxID=2883123 RepID=A0A9X3NSD2_9ACTN|nr:(4Fe-4S)-binding protein [Streptomonospora mangrovi]MDA0567189.1 (4Fe-4S)-binding protein [Streptomonospora mangrovi]